MPYDGVSYYRLKQTDYNGQFKYAATVPVNFPSGRSIAIYPNPFSRNENPVLSIKGYKGKEVHLPNGRFKKYSFRNVRNGCYLF